MVNLPRLSILTLAAAAFLPVACSSQAEDPAEPQAGAIVVDAQAGRSFELRAGETGRIAGLGIQVFFRGVASDSRCPTDVTCVWEGDAALRIRATVGRSDEWTPFDLHTAIEPQTARIGEHTITVVGLSPSPESGRTIPNERYTVTLRVD
jgi:hypothetical protein